jgi:hypothetical protein
MVKWLNLHNSLYWCTKRQKVMKRTKTQHYVPQFTLRKFANAQGQIHVFDKHAGKSFSAAVNKTAAERYYYDFEFAGEPATLEPTLAKVESKAAAHIDRIIKNSRIDISNPLERGELACFLSIQMIRTPAHQAMHRDQWDRMEAYLRAEGMAESFFALPPQIGEGENAERVLMARTIVNAPKDFGPAFIEKDWILLRTDAQHPFIVGDHPLCLHNDIDSGIRGNLGLKVQGIQIYFPLTPELALALYCPSHQEALLADIKKLDKLSESDPSVVEKFGEAWSGAMDIVEALQTGGVLDSKSENVDFFNSLQIATAERFVFSSDGNFTLVKDMIQTNSELKRGRRMEEATGKF